MIVLRSTFQARRYTAAACIMYCVLHYSVVPGSIILPLLYTTEKIMEDIGRRSTARSAEIHGWLLIDGGGDPPWTDFLLTVSRSMEIHNPSIHLSIHHVCGGRTSREAPRRSTGYPSFMIDHSKQTTPAYEAPRTLHGDPCERPRRPWRSVDPSIM